MAAETDDFADWVGRQEYTDDVLSAERVAALAATLDATEAIPVAGDPLPPLRHWLFFWALVPGAELGGDGHPRLGGFLPPIGNARRMWAGSRVTFPGRLVLGQRVRRRSTITRITAKSGRSGRLVFVGLRHEIAAIDGDVAIIDEQDIVYRQGAGTAVPAAAEPAPAAARYRLVPAVDPPVLFRYSALTFNAHRIHYDRPYATEREGYPGLVVHGPLLATLMVDLARRAWPERRLTSFAFRGQRPVIEGRPFSVCADPADEGQRLRLWVADADGCLAMQGEAGFG